MDSVALIGFGEAGRAFVGAPGWTAATHVYDRRDDADMRAAIAAAGLAGASSAAEAVAGADAVISVVTADQALAAARAAAAHLAPGALFLDLNSVAPETKRGAARVIEAASGRYVDVAVMAPVHPARLAVPLLVGGPYAGAGAALLRAIGFTNVRALGGRVGAASSIKMIRSVMVKGIEALTAECLLAAEAAGVREEVLASLDASEKPRAWAERADYNLERMMVHGLRRADEMDEVVKTLDALGTGAALARAAALRQRTIGARRLAAPAGLDAKLAALRVEPEHRRDAA